ncbi:MAG TPA: DUF962 domain-containing protein [Candidatus Aquabacterium excrementipullorum]|nr:DUF962 domain-containing protein [Candidatus Aquabacterium excrementipullorum]
MKTLTEQLTQYASYHRDRRNVLTHFVGIPMIVLSVSTLLARPVLGQWALGSATVDVTPSLLLSLLAAVFYLRLDLRYGLVMALWLAASNHVGRQLALEGTALWLGSGAGLFIVGWAIQFLGHAWEGRKPAFVDDLIGLAMGPLFVVAELGFFLGLRRDLFKAVEANAGEMH